MSEPVKEPEPEPVKEPEPEPVKEPEPEPEPEPVIDLSDYPHLVLKNELDDDNEPMTVISGFKSVDEFCDVITVVEAPKPKRKYVRKAKPVVKEPEPEPVPEPVVAPDNRCVCCMEENYEDAEKCKVCKVCKSVVCEPCLFKWACRNTENYTSEYIDEYLSCIYVPCFVCRTPDGIHWVG